MKEKIIPSSEKEREKLFDWFRRKLESVFMDETERELFLLAFIEAVNNAAEHGNKGDPDKSMIIGFCLRKDFACISVEDEGEGFEAIFPDLKKVEGRKGRGLGFIKNNTNHLFFNKKGNRITFSKGGETVDMEMDAKLENIQATLNITPKGDALVTNLKIKKENKFVLQQEIGEVFDLLSVVEKKAVYVDLKNIRILTSLAWGTIFAEAEKEDLELIHLFNANETIRSTAKQMGIEERNDHYSKIKISAGKEEVEEIFKASQKEEQLSPAY